MPGEWSYFKAIPINAHMYPHVSAVSAENSSLNDKLIGPNLKSTVHKNIISGWPTLWQILDSAHTQSLFGLFGEFW